MNQAPIYPANPGMPLLQVEKVSKRFGGIKVFEDISLELNAGEVLGVIGPNGAGKTTLINVLCGSILPTEGRISLQGRDLAGQPLHSVSRLGMIRSFQQTNTFRNKTVRENLLFAMQFSGSGGMAWNDISGMLERFDLAGRLDEQSDKLPYGLQKMLGLMLAYVSKPKVLLLDEPAAGLELRERGLVDDFIATVQRECGAGVLLVEHDMDLIKRLCSRIIVLDGGRILAAGHPDEVLARQDVLNAYVGAVEDESEDSKEGLEENA